MADVRRRNEVEVKYMMLNQQEKKSFLADLEAMPDFLVEAFADLPESVLTMSGPNESFCPVEHVWHLADLEQQGFAQISTVIRWLRRGITRPVPSMKA